LIISSPGAFNAASAALFTQAVKHQGTRPESRARLQAAEEAWIRFRDRECAFIGAPTAGGSIHGMIVAQCQARLTLVRVKDLETQLNCQEGDLSCVRE